MPLMVAKRETAVIEDARFKAHRGPNGHPERPDRLTAVGEAVAAHPGPVSRLEPRAATRDEILLVHDRAHIANLEGLAGTQAHLDPDTFFSARSFEVAELAAGAAIELVRGVARGDFASGLAAVRPPGHHAEANRAMGFCLFNNVAIAARAVQASEDVGRILIIDWDVHHGNGTQHSFEADPSVLYASVHQFPFYPGTGDAGEIGVGRGEGTTLNIPLPAGCGDAEYLGAFQQLLVPAALAFRPELILVSCGFDAHADDPLAAMSVTEDGFRAMAGVVRSLADEICDGRIAFVLEGGYSLEGLQQGVRALLDSIVGTHPTAATRAGTPAAAGSALQTVLDRVCQAHGAGFPALRNA
jgi:acetoin utilization deacetylase AcuC-like enzyme